MLMSVITYSCHCSGQFQVERDDKSSVNDKKNRRKTTIESNRERDEERVGENGEWSVGELNGVGVAEGDELDVGESSEESDEEIVSPALLVPRFFLCH